ncbi:hypothetical protein DM02DRAFT_656892 [Periconia macrospinosa]|uniref:Uncharacterized protein n=1 Tax=Periconia macrospinosa TaxID=97972 RepID=A0A2V1DLE1_9PLEO|nr:hypothetical protein DM02DRAFT_656892 [Periconia macrospinosa]
MPSICNVKCRRAELQAVWIILRENCFSSVSGDVEGKSAKLEGGVIFRSCVTEARDIDIAACCTALRVRRSL